MGEKPSWRKLMAIGGALAVVAPFTGPGAAILEPLAGMFSGAGRVLSVLERLGPMNEGPLDNSIANTFRSGTYTGRTLSEPTTLWRVIGEGGNPNGHFWTGVEPRGPLQSVIDLGLDQNWGNTATRVISREFSAGTRVYEGYAAGQRGLVGGGSQIYIPY